MSDPSNAPWQSAMVVPDATTTVAGKISHGDNVVGNITSKRVGRPSAGTGAILRCCQQSVCSSRLFILLLSDELVLFTIRVYQSFPQLIVHMEPRVGGVEVSGV